METYGGDTTELFHGCGVSRFRRIALFQWPFEQQNSLIVAGWGFWLAIGGMFLTVVGFGITVFQVRKVKSASDAVSLEVERIRESLARYDAGQEIAKANYALNSVRRHLRNQAWLDVADSYEDVRRSIIQFKSNSLFSGSILLTKIEEASLYIERLCGRIESGMSKPPVTINVYKTSSMIRKHGQLIAEIKFELEKDLV